MTIWYSKRLWVPDLKAPTYQQLYMDFTNSIVGYSVFGTTNINKGIEKFKRENAIEKIMIDPRNIKTLNPETSISYNLGLNYNMFNHFDFSINYFFNKINDMIDVQPIAYKYNGQGVWTYFNLKSIFTTGFESSFKVHFFKHFSLTLSGQYLKSGDYDMIDSVKAGKVFMNIKGGSRIASESDYGGLFNRSKYTGSFNLRYENTDEGINCSLRGLFRGKFGYTDKDGNSILAGDAEYVKGYSLYYISINKIINEYAALQLGADNLLNYKADRFVSSTPPRTIYLSIFLKYN